MEKLANYIGGEIIPPVDNNYIDNIDPSTGKVYSLIPDSSEKDVFNAIQAAEKTKRKSATKQILRV